MATGGDVLAMLIPTGGWVIYGDDFDSIIYDNDVIKVTRKQFTDGFAQFDAWQAQQDADRAALIASRNAKLLALGLTVEELSA